MGDVNEKAIETNQVSMAFGRRNDGTVGFKKSLRQSVLQLLSSKHVGHQ